jgi:hypothetical protein
MSAVTNNGVLHQMAFTDHEGLVHTYEFFITGVQAAGAEASVKDMGRFSREMSDSFMNSAELTISTKVVRHTLSIPAVR